MSIRELHENGSVALLVKAGIITPSAMRKLEYFVEVKNLEHQGVMKSHAVEQVAEKCRVCEDTVWKAIRSLKSY